MLLVMEIGMHRDVVVDIRAIFNVSYCETAKIFLRNAVEKYTILAPKPADWVEANLPEDFTVFAFPR